jgi:hypothetical protein
MDTSHNSGTPKRIPKNRLSQKVPREYVSMLERLTPVKGSLFSFAPELGQRPIREN